VEPAHRFLIARHHGRVECCSTGQVPCVEVGAEIDQKREQVVLLQANRKMERRLAVLESRHPPIKSFRVLLGDATDGVGISCRKSRKDVVVRTVFEKNWHDIHMRSVRSSEYRRPADDVGLVDIPMAMNVGPCREEHAHHVDVAGSRRKMQRSGVVAAVARIRVGSSVQQQPDHFTMTACGCRVQGGAAVSVTRARHGRGRGQQQVHHGMVAAATGFDELGDTPALDFVDVCLERSPAWKAVLLCDVEQCRRELGSRVAAPEIVQTILGQLFQELERRTFWELRVRHRPLPSLVPGVRVSRAGSQGL
jgi:hypothetical protein